MVTINHKRGDTLELACSVPLVFGQTLTGTQSQIRRNGELVENLTITVDSPTVDLYKFTISATASQSELWAIGEHLVDIQYVVGDKITSTETFSIVVVEDITR